VLERCFDLSRRGATVGAEVRGGLTTFMVMAYIIFVNPAILGFAGIPALQGQGPGFAATQAATCLVAGVMTIAMGLVANYPLALASGMGLNAAVAFQLVAGLKLPWPAAMGVIALEGVVITVLVLTGFREAIMHAIPASLKRAIGAGIGLFILFIGLNTAGIVKPGPPGVPVTLGELTAAPVAVALFGLLLMVWFQSRGMASGLLLGIALTTLLALAVNAWTGGRAFPLPGQAVIPKSFVAWPDLSSLGAGLDFTVFVRVGAITAAVTIFSIMLSDFFDTMGTVVGIGTEAGWLEADGRLPRLNRVLLVDSLAAVAGGVAGASSATTYVESAAGVAAGAKTGLASVVTGLCFFAALFLAPSRGGRSRPGDRARPHPGRIPHDGTRARHPVRRPRGGFPRAPHRDAHAFHLLDHGRHRGGIRRLLRHQASPRQGRGGACHDVRDGRRLLDLLRHAGRAGAPARLRAPAAVWYAR